MKSDVYQINAETLQKVLSEVDRIGIFCGLSKENSMKLQLLTEEMYGLTEHVLADCISEFWVENEGTSFTLNLRANSMVNLKQKDELVSMSTKKENVANKGILGKIKGVFQSFMMGENEMADEYKYGAVGMSVFLGESYAYVWSMANYQVTAPEADLKENWDGLEKSIIASFADDVVIGVKSTMADMIVKKKF